MIFPLPIRRPESWKLSRNRMLRETEAFLEDGLRHSAQHPRIPAIPVGSGSFPRGLAEIFWAQILGSS